MKTYVFEGHGSGGNWGKFLVGVHDSEWSWRSQIDDSRDSPLLGRIGWTREHIWVLDLQTCEGGAFRPGGYAKADLDKHRIWVCPLFEPFLTWLYLQDLSRIDELPQLVELDVPLEFAGYRRPGPGDEEK